jgi:hypothetical protein
MYQNAIIITRNDTASVNTPIEINGGIPGCPL